MVIFTGSTLIKFFNNIVPVEDCSRQYVVQLRNLSRMKELFSYLLGEGKSAHPRSSSYKVWISERV